MTDFSQYKIDELCEFINGFAFKSGDYVEKSADTLEVFRMGYIARGGGFKEDSTPVFVPKSYGSFLHDGTIAVCKLPLAQMALRFSS